MVKTLGFVLLPADPIRMAPPTEAEELFLKRQPVIPPVTPPEKEIAPPCAGMFALVVAELPSKVQSRIVQATVEDSMATAPPPPVVELLRKMLLVKITDPPPPLPKAIAPPRAPPVAAEAVFS
ncbi:MAG TPA: hypothetical protein PLL53_19520 [Saprospiraceae bacterium]|nr:hypothetical protein [Saprospiraceae bacterium]